MTCNSYRICILLFTFFFLAQYARAQEPIVLNSPDGNVEVSVSFQEKIGQAGPQLYYSIRFGGADVILDSPFGLEFKAPFARNLNVRDVRRESVDETWQRLWGKRKNVRNHYNEMTLVLEETLPPRRQIELFIRAYDDGVAIRYLLPEAWGDFELAAEHTVFRFPGNPTVWAANYGGHYSSQESEFVEQSINQLSLNEVYGLPLLARLTPTLWVALTEANLTDWAGMHLTPATSRSTLVSSLAPRLDAPDVVVRSTAPRTSPWRVIMIGNRPGAMIESDIVQNLNDPPQGDFSWVKPGIASWDWWNGPYLPDVDFEVGMNTATMKKFVDLAAEMGWEYVLVDAGWYVSQGRPEAGRPGQEIMTPVPSLDMPELVRYAREKDVDVVVWLYWTGVEEKMEEAFPLYEQWGISGVKIDFMDRDDQQMVNFYHRVARLAARHHLLVDFHGAYKPTGVSRTYPNLITREGVLGNEYNKWSARVTPEHNVTIPFTRGMLGEMDYTPGGFRNKTVDTFRPVNTAPFVMGTRVHQLAMFVVYESAFGVAADSPYNYHTSPAGLDFLKQVPTTWDDTRVLQGYPGDFITVARKSGDAWYVASMSDERARNLELDLSFLGNGTYRAEIWADAYEAAEFPDRLMKQERQVTASDRLPVSMAPAGGHIVRLTPVD